MGGLPLSNGAADSTAKSPVGACTGSALPDCLAKPLEPPDSHHLNAAQGWLGLGDHRSAFDELECIDPLMQSHPDVLAVRCEIYTAAMNWPAVAAISWTLVKLIPDQPCGWIQRSFALHELKRTRQALDLLLPAAEKFPKVPAIPYNLACYCAQLGKLEDAGRWLRSAYEIGDRKELELAALGDPDLAPLVAKPSLI
jgi:tetratricopeptide (TPR) repeat protein